MRYSSQRLERIRHHDQCTDKGKLATLVKGNMPLLILVGMVLVGSIVSEYFLTTSNIFNILRQVSINGILAAGFTLVILIDGFDMSLGASVSACAVTVVAVLSTTHSIPLAVASSLVLGRSLALSTAP